MNTNASLNSAPLKIPPEISEFFDNPPLIRGEDPKKYDNFLSQFTGSVRPQDFIEWMYVKDVCDITWEIRRNRWVRSNIINIERKAALRYLLTNILDIPVRDRDSIAEKLISNDPATTKLLEPQMKTHEINIDVVMAKAFERKLETLDAINRMVESAEKRRDKLLDSIKGRREFARDLRKVAEVEDTKPHLASPSIEPDGAEPVSGDNT